MVDLIAHFKNSLNDSLRALAGSSSMIRGLDRIYPFQNRTCTPNCCRSRYWRCTKSPQTTEERRCVTKKDYLVWYAWALMNFRLAQQFSKSQIYCGSDNNVSTNKGSNQRHTSSVSSKTLQNMVAAVVRSFVEIISLRTKLWSASVHLVATKK